ncbi:hypothetical protein B0H14DRAFT_2575371 [Mycena olivaceomarginata]|nr:hypothetical protein B0H14DRAFT_2575371 [Mycena olivaceomarginata]
MAVFRSDHQTINTLVDTFRTTGSDHPAMAQRFGHYGQQSRIVRDAAPYHAAAANSRFNFGYLGLSLSVWISPYTIQMAFIDVNGATGIAGMFRSKRRQWATTRKFDEERARNAQDHGGRLPRPAGSLANSHDKHRGFYFP